MTNEEKAIELVKQFQSCINNGVSIDAAVMACLMEMAEWKDKQYSKAFAPILIEIDELKHQVKSLLP